MRRLLPGVLFVAMIGILAVLANQGESPLTASSATSQFIVTQSSSPPSAAPGGVIAYTVTTTNPGTATVTRIVTSPFVPAGLTYLPNQSNPHCALSNGVVYCRSDDNQNGYTLEPGASKRFVVSYQVPASQTCGSTVTHTVAAQSLQTSPAPPGAAWSTATTSVTCGGSSSPASSSRSSSPSSSLISSSSSAISSSQSSSSPSAPLIWNPIANTTFGGYPILSVTYGNGRFVAVGWNNKGIYSLDGVTWTAIGDMKFGTDDIHSITYGNGRFVAVGTHGKGAYSLDGVTWTAIGDMKFGNAAIQSVTYGNGRFVAVGYSYNGSSYTAKGAYSLDGVTWTTIGDMKFGNAAIQSVTYGNGRFVAVGDRGVAAYSSNGITWTPMNVPFGGYPILSVTYGNGRFVAVGYTADWNGKGAYSLDGVTWTAIGDMKIGNSILSVTYGNGRFVAVGEHGKGAYSSDGITWTAVGNMTFGDVDIRSITYGNGRFVAVGNSGKGAYSGSSPPSACTTSWSCGAWSLCINGTMTRTCGDANICGTTVDKPAESQPCTCAHSGGETYYVTGSVVDSTPNTLYFYDTPQTINDLCSWNTGGAAAGDSICPYSGFGKQFCTPPGLADQKCYSCPNGCGNGKCTGTCASSNWNCAPWTVCVNGQQTRYCSDANTCAPDKVEVQSCTAGQCAPVWTCTPFGSCSRDRQAMRTCLDSNNCGTTAGKPDETVTCPATCFAPNGDDYFTKGSATRVDGYSQTDFCNGNEYSGQVNKYYCDTNGDIKSVSFNCPAGCVNGACTAPCTSNWTCTAWSACTNGTVTRLCTDSHTCTAPTIPKPSESKPCGSKYVVADVTTPSGGAAFKPDDTLNVTWTSSGFASGDKLSIVLLALGGDFGRYYVIANDIPAEQGRYSFTLPEFVVENTYKNYRIWVGHFKVEGTAYGIPPLQRGYWGMNETTGAEGPSSSPWYGVVAQNLHDYAHDEVNIDVYSNPIEQVKIGNRYDSGNSIIFTWLYRGDPGKKVNVMLINGANRYYVVGEDIPATAGRYAWSKSDIQDHSTLDATTAYVWVGEYKPPARTGNWNSIKAAASHLPYATNYTMYANERWNGRTYEQILLNIGGRAVLVPDSNHVYYTYYGGEAGSQFEYINDFGGTSTARKEIVNRYLKASAIVADDAQSVNISWSSSNVERVNIVLVRSEGQTGDGTMQYYSYSVLAEDLPTNGSYRWAIPDYIDGTYKIWVGEYKPPYASGTWGYMGLGSGGTYSEYGLVQDAHSPAYAESEAMGLFKATRDLFRSSSSSSSLPASSSLHSSSSLSSPRSSSFSAASSSPASSSPRSSSSALSSSSHSSSSIFSSVAPSSSSRSSAVSSLAANGDLDIWIDMPVFTARGGTLTYTIWVQNVRAQDVTDAVVSTSIPNGMQFQPLSSDSCWKTAGATLTCNTAISAGSRRSFPVSFFVSSSNACPAFKTLNAVLQVKSQGTFQLFCESSGKNLRCVSPQLSLHILKVPTDRATYWYWILDNGEVVRITNFTFIRLLNFCSINNNCTKNDQSLRWQYWDDTIIACSSVSSSSSSTSSSPQTPPTKSLTLLLSAPESAERNGIATFTLTATNDGSVGYTHYSIAAMNDAKTIFLPERSDPNCSAATNTTVLCDGHNFDRGFALLPGESKSFQVSYLIPKTVPCESSLPYSMTGGDNSVPSATTTVTCSTAAHADIALSYESPPSSVPQGGTATFTVTARNIGNIAEEEVVIGAYTNNLLTYLPAQSSPHCTQKSGDHYVYCREAANAGFRLLPGESRSFDLRYSVYPYCTPSRLGHQIFLSQPQSDGNTENNTAEISATMYCSPASSRSSSSRTPSSSSRNSSSSSLSQGSSASSMLSSSSSRSPSNSSLSSSSQSSSMSSTTGSTSSANDALTGTVSYTVVSFISCPAAEISALLKLEELIAEKRASCFSGCFSTNIAPTEMLTLSPLCFARARATWVCAPSC